VKNLPKHGFCLPKFVLKDRYELSPDQVIEPHDIDNVDDENCPVLHIFKIEAT
jgi:hypothetical protein